MHRTDRNSLSNPRLRVLEAVHHLGGEHVTINQLATHLGGHPNASRAHLTALARDGFIKIADIPGEGPGRRPRGHTLTDAGRRVIDPVEHAGPSLTGAFASYLVQTGHGKDDAREIGRIWGEASAGALPEQAEQSLDAVVEVLDMLGFDPDRLETAEGQALVLRTCPLLIAQPDDFLCEIHHGLIDGVLRRIGAAEGVTLLPFAEADGCRVELSQPRAMAAEVLA